MMNDLKFTSAGNYMKSMQQRIGFACKEMTRGDSTSAKY